MSSWLLWHYYEDRSIEAFRYFAAVVYFIVSCNLIDPEIVSITIPSSPADLFLFIMASVELILNFNITVMCMFCFCFSFSIFHSFNNFLCHPLLFFLSFFLCDDVITDVIDASLKLSLFELLTSSKHLYLFNYISICLFTNYEVLESAFGYL